MIVKVMKPVFKLSEESSAKFILYPYWIFQLRLFYKRLGMRDRVIDYLHT